MNHHHAKKYFIYARKSTDSEDKQVASLDDQIAELKKLAERLELNVIEIIQESRSAKSPGRPRFNDMMKRLKKGEADGILSWKLNRLARNSIDGGEIIWHLQNGFVKHIQTYSSSYTPMDNVLMMYIEFGMANQYVNDLSVDTSRGMRRKAERGWYPTGVLPIGYMHTITKDFKLGVNKRNTSQEEIIPHPHHFRIIRQLWSLLLTGHYTISDLKRRGDELGLKNRNGRNYSFNSYTNLFRNEFYFGYFYWKDDQGVKRRFKGKHKPMITELEFLQAQRILDNRPAHCKRERKYHFPLRGMIICGECKGHVSAENKYQVICSECKTKFSAKNKEHCPKCNLAIVKMDDPSVLDKTYYRCTRNHGKCTQPGVTDVLINHEVTTALEEYSINEEFYHFIIKVLKRFNEEENQDVSELKRLKKRETELTKRIENLSIMCADGDLSKEQFVSLKQESEEELSQHKIQQLSLEQNGTNWMKLIKDASKFLLTAHSRYSQLKKDQRLFMVNFASNLILKDKSLEFITVLGVQAVHELQSADRAHKMSFEPKNPLVKQRDLRSFEVRYLNLGPTLRRIRNLLNHRV